MVSGFGHGPWGPPYGAPVVSRPDVDPDLLLIVGQRWAVEVLDALCQRPSTLAQLRGRLRASPGAMVGALRRLGALGAVRRCGCAGSWDVPEPDAVVYELTGVGARWARQLMRLDVWVALYERGWDES